MAHYRRDGKVKSVKNLGWVLRYSNKNIITQISVLENDWGGELMVFFNDGTLFYEQFADYGVLCDWLGSRISWYGTLVHYTNRGGPSVTTQLGKYL